MKLAFKINYYNPVPKWVTNAHIAFADWLADVYPIQHTIRVYLLPSISIPTHDGRRCWGYFHQPGKHYWGHFAPGDQPAIVLACGRPKIDGRLPNRDLQIAFLLSNFAHEFVHYEQWRDSKPTNHRGIENRVDSLVIKFNKYVMERP